MFDQLPPEIPLPSIAQACKWADTSERTRDTWVKDGLVRRFIGGADEASVVELVLVRHMLRFIASEEVGLAWAAIRDEILNDAAVPERLDLIWFQDPPQSVLARTDTELAVAIRTRPRKSQVIPLASLIEETAGAWRLGWRCSKIAPSPRPVSSL